MALATKPFGGIMILERRNTLKPLIETSGGVHLTAYVNNKGDLNHLKAQIQAAIEKAEIEIEPVMSAMERSLFLAPLRLLITNERLLKSIKHNVAIFRKAKFFRMLALPIDVDEGCIVATTFHVKPLLRWMRVDQDFLLLGLERNAAHLYVGSQHSLRLVDTLKISEGFVKAPPKKRLTKNSVSRTVVRDEAIDTLADWIRRHTHLAKPKLFVAGDSTIAKALREANFSTLFTELELSESFTQGQIPALCFEIRTRLEVAAMLELENVSTEFDSAEGRRAVYRNVFQIAKAVAQGRVRKLWIADGVKIFGKFNSQTGALAIHPRDLDHEDDDILDDLAQGVLATGGEVIVTSKEDTPGGHLAWALLDCPILVPIQAVDASGEDQPSAKRIAV